MRIICLLTVCLLSACAVGRPIHYYTINRPAVAAAAVKPDGPSLLVGRIATPEALEDDRIRYRAGANEVGSYEYQRWTNRPAQIVRDVLVQTLRASGQYRQVEESATSAIGDYLIRGKLYEFSEVDRPGIKTRVSLQLKIVNRKDGLVVWDRHYNRDEPVNGKTIQDVVASLDHNLQQVITDAAAAIDSFLSNRQ